MEDLGIEQVVSRITRLNDRIREFWSDTHGWAPREAANLLTKSRLDWQVSLSSSLHMWITQPDETNIFAVQILGYANLGALVENTLRLFLSVWYDTYKNGVDAITKRGVIQDPDGIGIKLEDLRIFFKKNIWHKDDDWDAWIARIQSRRNAIHAFKDRDIGTHAELIADIQRYRIFLHRINGQLPYPDDIFIPTEY